jgi:2-dehydro-3-deoxyglucarate aldolase
LPRRSILSKNPVKHELKAGRVVVGTWLTMAHPSIAEILAISGFDFIVVDMEHSVVELSSLPSLFLAMEAHDVVPLVRVGENDDALIKRVMDAGACGVIVPMVNSAEEARAAVDAVRYPPRGRRGVGLSRAQGYGPGFEEYVKKAGDEALVVVQIEHERAVSNLEAILGVDGVDAFIVGPYDLSASMGAPGDLERPEVSKALERIRETGRRLGVPGGFHLVEPDPVKLLELVHQGFQLLAYSVDMLFLGRTSAAGLAEIRKGLSS